MKFPFEFSFSLLKSVVATVTPLHVGLANVCDTWFPHDTCTRVPDFPSSFSFKFSRVFASNFSQIRGVTVFNTFISQHTLVHNQDRARYGLLLYLSPCLFLTFVVFVMCFNGNVQVRTARYHHDAHDQDVRGLVESSR
jgi:hypothetical protein